MDSRTLIQQMQQFGLWPDDPEAQGTITALAQRQTSDIRGFARELLQRDLLTAYQVNALMAGKGAQLVVGAYVVIERLGEGGMGQVFKARHRGTQQVVALKVIRPERVTNPIAVRRFQNEVRASEKMAHPNIVRSFDADQVDGTYYLAMEFIKGVDLSSFVKSRGPLPLAMALQLFAESARGLQHIHEHGLVHRDIKPGNLFLEEISAAVSAEPGTPTTNLQLRSALRAPRNAQYRLRILDLGLARLSEDDLRGETGSKLGLTQEGAVIGTADYMAPEQARDSRAADIRSDLYSLGCTFYFALAGQVPFPGGTAIEKMLHHQLDEPAPLEKLRPDLPPALGQITRRLMAKRPEDRFQTPAELATALAPWADLDGPPLVAIPIDAPQQPTLSDRAGETDEPVVIIDPNTIVGQPHNVLWLAGLVGVVAGVAAAAVGLFALLLHVLSKK
jgi:serine/threonine-protein kinase